MIKIFHTGDNHLDSAFSRLAPSLRERERERQRALFKRMMRFAREGEYDLVFICGDLFDSPDISPETEQAVTEAFAELNCPVVISPGNHDPYGAVSLYSSGKIPENVYVFSSEELQVFELEELGVSVCGYAFVKEELRNVPSVSVSSLDTCGIKLLCAHGELGVVGSRYAPISEDELAGFSYAALGHIHKISEPLRIGRGLAAYCGFPEGRGFDEEGEGGAMSVTIDGDRVIAERVIFAERRYIYASLDISGAISDRECVERLESYLNEKGYGKETALRLTLFGTVAYGYTPDTALIERMLSERLMRLEITNKTLPEIDRKALEKDYTLRGEVYRSLLPELESEDEDARKKATKALNIALLAIEGRRISFE